MQLGDRSVLQSTATLACIGRRQAYFKDEFLSALEILHHGDLRPEQMRGSWAGAFGPTQFMPTAFKRYAVDANGDGRRDVVDDPADLIASTANNLKKDGWQPGQTWPAGSQHLRRAAGGHVGAVSLAARVGAHRHQRDAGIASRGRDAGRLPLAAASDVGLSRKINEDAFVERPEVGVWAVADGLGGHRDGEVASHMVCDALAELVPVSQLRRDD